MPLFYVQQVGPNLVMLSPVGATDPGFGNSGGGVDPGYGLGRPGGHPDQGLPGGGHISNRPPGSGGGGIPDNELPDHPPPQVAPGATLVLVRKDGQWNYAVIEPGSPPPKPLPGPPDHIGGRPPGQGVNRPDQGLPGNQPGMDQGLPGQRPPHASGQPVPPTAQPQRR